MSAMHKFTDIISFNNEKTLFRALCFSLFYLIGFSVLAYVLSFVLRYNLLSIISNFGFGNIGLYSVLSAMYSVVMVVLVVRSRKLMLKSGFILAVFAGALLGFVNIILGILISGYMSTYNSNRGLVYRLVQRFVPMYNRVMRRRFNHPQVYNFPELVEVYAHQDSKISDISDHLDYLFMESLKVNPKLIVELGVRGGESTKCLEKVAKICDSLLIQVDPDADSYHSPWKKSYFVAEDDIAFAKKFAKFCEAKNVVPKIDLLFIDTTHLYDQTVKEIREWYPLLAPGGRVIFHDTNMAPVSKRLDGTYNFGWDNNRGVIRPIEEYLGVSVNEKKDFVLYKNGWLVIHRSSCSGMTLMQRLRN